MIIFKGFVNVIGKFVIYYDQQGRIFRFKEVRKKVDGYVCWLFFVRFSKILEVIRLNENWLILSRDGRKWVKVACFCF